MRGFSCIIVASSEISFFLRTSSYNYAFLGKGKKKRDRERGKKAKKKEKWKSHRLVRKDIIPAAREYEETSYRIKLSFLSVRIQLQVPFLRLMPRRRSSWRGARKEYSFDITTPALWPLLSYTSSSTFRGIANYFMVAGRSCKLGNR